MLFRSSPHALDWVGCALLAWVAGCQPPPAEAAPVASSRLTALPATDSSRPAATLAPTLKKEVNACIMPAPKAAACNAPRPPPPPWFADNPTAGAIAYLAAATRVPDRDIAVMAQYLQRRFGRKDLARIAKKHLAGWKQNPDLIPMGRLIARTNIPEIPPGFEHFLHVEAFQCSKHPLPPDYLERLRAEGHKGGSSLMYAIAARSWAEELGCAPPDGAWKPLREEQELALIQLIKSDIVPGYAASEVSIQAIAWLYYSGRGADVDRKWLAAVKLGQRDDGGWRRELQDKKTNPRTTVHALWVLLESGTSKRADVRMIP